MAKADQINVLYLAGAAKIGGGNRSLLTLINGLDAARYQAYVLLPEDGPMGAALTEQGIPWEVVPFDRAAAKYWPFPLFDRIHCYYRYIRHHQIHLLHANSLGGYRGAGIAARLASIPRVCHIRFYEDEGGYQHAVKAPPNAVDLEAFQPRPDKKKDKKDRHLSFFGVRRFVTPLWIISVSE